MDIIDAGVKSIPDIGKDDLMLHFIYCGDYYLDYEEQTEKFKELILTQMRKYGIQSSVLTMLFMHRSKLITKEKVKKAVEGKLKNELDWCNYDGSINDDLETFLSNLQNQKEVKCESVRSFFLPKLTKKNC